MTDQTLAQLSNLAIYSAMVVLTLAMLADAVYLARLVPAREADRESRARARARDRRRRRRGRATRHPAAPASEHADGPDRARRPSRSRPARPPASAGR